MNAQSNRPAGSGTMVRIAYRTVTIDGLDIFYREAGPKDAPVVLLLHGFPTSSHMFRNLIPALADEFHLVAPDYPGCISEGDTSDEAIQNLTEAMALYLEPLDDEPDAGATVPV